MTTLKYGFVFVLFIAGCTPSPSAPPLPKFEPHSLGEKPGVPNLYQLSTKLYSGGTPEGPAGFATLKELGIRTIISVDGAAPDVEEAFRHGIHYIHLPMGYDGVPRDLAVGIAKIVEERFPDRGPIGPFYVHCHHGLHRGPAAAVAAWRCLDSRCTAELATAFLQTAGTDPHYEGLYSSVQAMSPATPFELAPSKLEFTSKVSDLAQEMVRIDESWDRIKLFRKSDWKSPQGDPANEVLQLLEHFRELARTPETAKRAEGYRKFLTEAVKQTEDLEKSLRSSENSSLRKGQLESAFQAVGRTCKACHNEYRDKH